MQMKKHIIAALVGVMILAVAGPAFAAANVGGNMEFGYSYDLQNQVTDSLTDDWGMNLNGNISDSVSYKIGLNTNALNEDLNPMTVDTPWGLHPSEVWIQAKGTPVGTVKLGAFDMAFGQGNGLDWQSEPVASVDEYGNPIIIESYDFPVNVQIDNQIAGMNVSAGARFSEQSTNLEAVGASVTAEPIDALQATVGVVARDNGTNWDPQVGYGVAYTGIENLALGVKGNLYDDELIGSADYQLMPEVAVNAMYGQKTANVDDENVTEIAKVGATAALENGLHAGASYEMSTFASDSSDHRIVRLNAGYDYQLAQGLTVGIDGDYAKDDQASNPDTTLGVSAAVNF